MILTHSASCLTARFVILAMMTAVLQIHVGPIMVHSFMITSPIVITPTKTTTSTVSRIHPHASVTKTKIMSIDDGNMDSATTTSTASKSQKIVIVSPPGGIGEVTAVKVAQQGYDVKWLVIRSSPESDKTNNYNNNNRMNEKPAESVVTISQEILNDIARVGGSMQLAGADTTDLMSSIDAITTWCDQANVIVSTVDGVDQGDTIVTRDSRKRLTVKDENENDTRNEWKKAIYVATRAVATKTRASTKIAILSAAEMEDTKNGDDDDSNNMNSLLSPLTNLFKSGGGGDNMNIPTSLSDALTVSNSNNNNNAEKDAGIIKLRHGAVLFGLPETSPDFTPLINGPRKIPEFCPEYSNRQIRIDPTYNVLSGTNMFRSMSTTSMDTTMSSRTSRHAMGDAIVTLLNMIQDNKDDVLAPLALDVCVTSQPGTDIVTPDEWNNEFQRVITTLSSSGDALSSSLPNTATTSGMQLFQVDFGSVPNVDRLTDWMTTKWAPAILRTYDIAAIRTGPRPVYANRIALDDPNDTGKLEIVWQQLINFEPVIIGRMTIEITNTAMKASRIVQVGEGALAGEDILVRRLAEAASQAIEKGLATKVGIYIVCICFTIMHVNIL